MAGRTIKKHLDNHLMKHVFADLGISGGKHAEALRSFSEKHGIQLVTGEKFKITVLRYLFSKGKVEINNGDIKGKRFADPSKIRMSPKVATSEIKAVTGFYETEAWQILRRATIKKYGCICMKCGTKDCEMHVDHIKPRSKYPKLELDPNNLQVLCRSCNMDKSNIDETDYRPAEYRTTVSVPKPKAKSTIKFSMAIMKEIYAAARKMTETEFATEMASRYSIVRRND